MPASRDGLSESYMIGDEAMMHHQQQMQQRSFPGANYAHEPPPPQQQVSVSHPRGRATCPVARSTRLGHAYPRRCPAHNRCARVMCGCAGSCWWVGRVGSRFTYVLDGVFVHALAHFF